LISGMEFPAARRQSRWLCLLVVLAFFAGPLQSAYAVTPDRHIDQYGHRSWKIDDGYLRAPAISITQDRDGYLWIGTDNGLYRFDGVRFVLWTPPAGMHLPSPKIISLLADRDGGLWIGTEAGLAHWNRGHLENYLEHEGWIYGFEQDRDGAVWFAVDSYNTNESRVLCSITGAGIVCYGSRDGLKQQVEPTQLVRDADGYLWMGTSTSVIGWKPSSSRVYSLHALRSNSGQMGVRGLALDQDGSLLVGMMKSGPGRGLQRISHDRWSTVSAPGFDGSRLNVTYIFRDRHDAVWIGTVNAGLYRLYRGEPEHFDSRNGLSGDSVSAILEDREGTLWIATDKGLDAFHDRPVLTLPRSEWGIAELDNVITTRDGTLWIGGDGGLFTLQKGASDFRSRGGNLRGKQVTTIFEDHRGRMWIGVDDGLNILSGDSLQPVRMPNGSHVGMIVSMAEGPAGDLWAVSVGPPRHVIRIDPDSAKVSSVPDMPETSKIAGDPGGGLWLGLNNGDLNHYYKGELTRYPFHHGPNTRIQQLSVRGNGDVMAAAPFGLIQWRSGDIRVLGEQGGLPCSNISNFVFDLQGNLWLYTECGLAEVMEADFTGWQQNPAHKVLPRLFNWMDGVRNSFPPFEGAARSGDGRLWFNNQQALEVVDPTRIAKNQVPPPVHIEAVMADRITYPLLDGLHLPKLTHDLEIDYTALSLIAPQKVQFRYMLSGVDQGWQSVGVRRQAFYMNLKPGAYTFRVIASNNDGVWNEAGDTLRFIIPPMFYQTHWFASLCAALFLGIVTGFYQLRLRRLARQYSIRLEDRVSERARIARELHDTLLQGFQGLLFRLQAAANLLPERPADAKQSLDSAIDQAAQAITDGRDAVQNLRSSTMVTNDLSMAIGMLGDELGATQIKDANASPTMFDVAVEGTSRDLHPVIRDDLYRIAGEALRNAFRHGRARRIEVQIHYDDKQLQVRVRDDGKGIDRAALQERRPGHFGLPGMRERAEVIGGQLDVWSEVGVGTEVDLKVPAVAAYATPRAHGRWWSLLFARIDLTWTRSLRRAITGHSS
jgi:signal transduction histidine kinase/ligand-binding sensor domain-containing protein